MIKENECVVKFNEQGRISFVGGKCKKKNLKKQFDKVKEALQQ